MYISGHTHVQKATVHFGSLQYPYTLGGKGSEYEH